MNQPQVFKINSGLHDNTVSGVYGAYINLENGTGIKVLKASGSPSVEAVWRSEWFKQAWREGTLLKAAEFTGLTPKFYDIVVVEAQERVYDHNGRTIKKADGSYERKATYYIGLHMQHIDGVMMCRHPEFTQGDECYEKSTRVRDSLKIILRAMGVVHNDLHDGNVMVDREGRFYVIDFSPNHSSISRPLKKMFAPKMEMSMMGDFDMDLFRAAQEKFQMG